jgi:hypothetical protein
MGVSFDSSRVFRNRTDDLQSHVLEAISHIGRSGNGIPENTTRLKDLMPEGILQRGLWEADVERIVRNS